MHLGTLQYLQGKKKGLSKLRSTSCTPSMHMHRQPPVAKHFWLMSRGSSVLAPRWLKTSSPGPFPAWFLGLGSKPGMSVGLLLVANGQAILLALETINNPLKTKEHLSFLGNFGRSGFQQPNAFQMLFFLMPNAFYMIPRHPVVHPRPDVS